ncbi:MAG TPA: hypothetical protein VE755_02575 [Myxococcales bacterium]|nr:hypothetical protein [Myxococcales bacterium]
MLRELPALREDAAALAADLCRERYRRFAGLPRLQSLREVLRTHKLAASAEAIAQAREALANAEAEDPRRPARIARLKSLLAHLARTRALALEPGAAQDLFDLPQRPLVRPPGDAGLHGAIPPLAVERELPAVRAREKRAELEAALAAALQPADGARSAMWDAAMTAQSEAGMSVPDVAAAWSQELLDETDPVLSDLGSWLLERHTGAKPGSAVRHDVLHLLHAPRCAGAFPAGEMQRTVRRWAEMLRLELEGVKLDDDDRPLKHPGAHTEPIDPPWEVAITLLPQEGPRALAGLLGALGIALLRTGPPAEAPPEDLWLGDRAVVHACAALLEGLTRDREWLRRCAKASLARDDERAIAIAAVIDARLAAARTLAALQARESGFGSKAAAAHREFFARAAGAELPAGLALRGLDPWFDGFAELQGRALAARLAAFLRERYDEDWWRNPRAAASLHGLWGRGGRPTCAELWTEVGGEPAVDPLVFDVSHACR